MQVYVRLLSFFMCVASILSFGKIKYAKNACSLRGKKGGECYFGKWKRNFGRRLANAWNAKKKERPMVFACNGRA